MSLIADALKAAQEAKAGPVGSAAHTATARRILAPAVRTRSTRSGIEIPKHLQLAMAVFGVALATAAAVVVAAPNPTEGDVPAPVELAGSPMLPLDGSDGGRREQGVTMFGDEAGEERPAGTTPDVNAEGDPVGQAAAGSGEAAATTVPDRRGSSGVAAAREVSGARPEPAASEVRPVAEPAPDQATRRETVADQPAAARAPEARGFELRLGNPAPRGSGQWFADALSAQRRGDYGAAIQLYERALQVDPDNVEALNNLGTVYQGSGNLPGAREAFRRAITIQPAYAAAWSNLGVVLGAMGEHSQSQAALTEAIRLDPANHGARVNLALQYQKQGLRGEARRLLDQVVQASPAMAEAHYALGRLLEEEADRDGAVRHYRLFLSTGAGRFPALEAAVRQRIQQLGG